MKRRLLFLFIACIALATTIQAQSKEKGIFIETSVAFSSLHYENKAVFIPAVGYQFNKQWAAGMKIGFETGNLPWTIYTPFVRFSFPEIGKLKIFTEAQFNIYESDAIGGQCGYSEFGLSFGLTYPLNRHFNLIGHYLFVGYSGLDHKEGAWLGNGDFALDANCHRAQLGLQFIF